MEFLARFLTERSTRVAKNRLTRLTRVATWPETVDEENNSGKTTRSNLRIQRQKAAKASAISKAAPSKSAKRFFELHFSTTGTAR